MALATRVRLGVGEVVISPAARANVLDALDHNRLSYGPYTRRFEQDFAALQKHRFACFMNSGTSALQVGLAAMKEHYGWKDGAGVVVPAVTFVASLNVILANKLTPILFDVDPDHYDLYPLDRYYWDTLSVGNAVAVMPCSLFGQPVDRAVAASARALGLTVIEDSCETMFVGKSDADVTCYSTYACHLINTGVGGFAATNDPDLATLIRSLANHGRSGIYTGIDEALGQWEHIEARFTFERQGYSYRATELEAAIGCAELSVWEANLLSRRIHAAALTSGLQGLPLQLPKERIPGDHSYMMFPLVCENDDRDQLIQHLESQGIETRYMLPLTNQPYVKALFGPDIEDRFPNAQRINQRGFYVPCHQYLSTDDVEYIIESFRSFYR